MDTVKLILIANETYAVVKFSCAPCRSAFSQFNYLSLIRMSSGSTAICKTSVYAEISNFSSAVADDVPLKLDAYSTLLHASELVCLDDGVPSVSIFFVSSSFSSSSSSSFSSSSSSSFYSSYSFLHPPTAIHPSMWMHG